MTIPPPSRIDWPDLARFAGLAVLYAVLAKLVLAFFSANGVVSMVWPPSGLALAALILGGRRYWPGVLLGAFAANLWADNTFVTALFISVGNTLEALVGLWLLSIKGGFDARLERPRHLSQLVTAAAVCATVSAVVGATTLLLSGFLTLQAFPLNLLQWWQGDLLGMLLVTPLILVWRQPPLPAWREPRRIVEFVLLMLLAFLCGQVVFLERFYDLFGPIAQVYWFFLFVSWAAERFGRHGVMLVVGITAIQALSGASLGLGLFATDIARTGLESFWFFMFLLTMVGLSMALLLAERNAIESELRREKQLSDDIISSLPGIFYMVDAQGHVVRWNQRFLEVSGYSDEDMLGTTALEFIDEHSRAQIADRIIQVFVEGEAVAEGGLLSKSGVVMPYGFSGRRTMIEGEAYLVGLGQDITQRKQAEEALRESETKYRLLFENTNTHIVIFDLAGTILMLNESNARMMGGTPADFIGKSIFDVMSKETVDLHRQRFDRIIREQTSQVFEDSFLMPDGVHWFSSQLQPVTDASGNAYGIQIVAIDITRRKRMEDSLRQSEELWKFALEGSGDAVWDWDVRTNRVKYSARWREMLGYSDLDAESVDDWAKRTHPDDQALVDANAAILLDSKAESSSIELRMRCKDGSWKWILARGMVVSRDDDGRPLRIVGTNADITLLKEHQQQLEHIAHYDALTNLPNRVLLGFRLQQAMAQCQRRNQSLAVAYLDLDGFKAVNDRHGHDVGDQLLVLIAQRMKVVLRECDTLARIGGDEFIAVLADLDQPQDCEAVLERLLQAAAAPATVGEALLQVSASIGVTLYPRDGVDAEQLMRHADQAMYQAKQAGRNRYHLFDVEQAVAVQAQRESIEHICGALERREFVLYYQPKVNMRSGAVIGVEALIRWQHPERGLLPPAAFLPVIEDQTISVEVGNWVIDAALTQMDEWLAAGLDLPISVNIAAYHLQQDNFVARLGELLAAHPGVNPAHLELEILETSALDDVAQVSEVMHACRAYGVTFALDDFGTGYSSLTYLKRLPAELLKIDQSFVRGMLDDPDDLAIVVGVVGLANAFRRKVIAEGVETVAIGEVLVRLGCELAQGYGIARPMPAAALPDWAGTWRPDASWTASERGG